ncbi:MAG TPA: endonuclease/exonuclease/phosphatase family protein [Methylomirabilota bacterium]|nr:endonuclease/exonuclease/phosphatase family protein [Methylomirabilota bacterium]
MANQLLTYAVYNLLKIARALFPVLLSAITGLAAERFTVATYNIENYLDVQAAGRELKSPESRAKVHEYILLMKPDVLALQEIGSSNSLAQLRTTLKAAGLDYPHTAFVDGPDPFLNLAVLSRFPIIAQRAHTNENYLLRGKRFRAARGFAEVDLRVNPHYQFTLVTAHLKSRRASAEADESEMREQEALLLREKVDAVFQRNPNANLIVLGDMNDVRSSKTVRTLMGRGRTALLDLRPSERNGDNRSTGRDSLDDRAITWTHHFVRDDTYSRSDYIFVSPGMFRELRPEATYIPTLANWGLASDRRPVIATFVAEEVGSR